MSWQMASLLLLGGSTILLFIGMPVAFSFIAINLVGAALFLGGNAGIHQLVRNSTAAVVNFSLTPIPLFILMGEVLFHTGLAIKVIEGIERLIQQVPGRLAVVAGQGGTGVLARSGVPPPPPPKGRRLARSGTRSGGLPPPPARRPLLWPA